PYLRCRRLPAMRRILPVPVTLKRRFTPLWVFILATSLLLRDRTGSLDRLTLRAWRLIGLGSTRRQDHRHVAPFHTYGLLNRGHALELCVDLIEQVAADLRVRDLRRAGLHRDVEL